jgi:hypothetical protein
VHLDREKIKSISQQVESIIEQKQETKRSIEKIIGMM